MTKQEIIEQLDKAEVAVCNAKLALIIAHNHLIEIETWVINSTLHRDFLKEKLERIVNSTPKYEQSARDLEVIKFQETFPELCEWAKDRDKPK